MFCLFIALRNGMDVSCVTTTKPECRSYMNEWRIRCSTEWYFVIRSDSIYCDMSSPYSSCFLFCRVAPPSGMDLPTVLPSWALRSSHHIISKLTTSHNPWRHITSPNNQHMPRRRFVALLVNGRQNTTTA